ncbi:MAG: SusC/RagA family TonB-linked outer membrane protein [Thalassobius sp.]|nr:SusC/RagA family TonB-linked outer membrane protein [Thalassovita sp.]
MKMKILLLLFIVPIGFCFAQKGTVTGTVISQEDGLPLPGASVIISGTSNGTITNVEGKYTLNNVPADAILQFSFIGYLKIEMEVNGRQTIDIALSADAQQLEEVVITGYSSERKVDLTGAITVVDVAPIEGQTRSSGNAMQALQGRVPGLFIEKGGDPSGASSRVLIRGLTTLGNNDPLYVIDGVPTKRPEVFASLNPDAIESIQVLKDASASSIYGSRAANGVIVVTTKSGTIGEKVSVSFNSNFSILSEKKQRYDMLNAVQRGEALWRASVNDGADPTEGYGEIYNFDWNGDFNNPVLNSVSVQPFVGGNQDVPAGDIDWQDAIYEPGYVTNNELTVSASSEKSSMMINLGYLKNTGILKYTGYERYVAKLNANTKLFNDKLKIGANTQISVSNQTKGASDVGGAATPGLGITLAPTIPVYDANGEYAGPLGAGYSDRNNPVLMQYLNRWDNQNQLQFFGNVFAELKLKENLTFRSNLGIDYSNFEFRNIEPRVNNGFITRSNNRLIIDGNKFSSLVFSNTLNYNVELGKSKIGALLGIEAIDENFDAVIAQANGFAIEEDSYFVLSAATGARTSIGTSTGNSLYSQFGKVNYSFDDKYLATLTVRRDGSSRFGKNNRYGIFPAVTLGWKISNEPFMSSLEFISNLKLRAGYGEVGNQEIGNVARFGLYESRYGVNQAQLTGGFFEIYNNVGTAYDINGNNTGNLPSGFVSTQAPNPDLKWETTKEWNVGMDFNLFDYIFSGSIDIYRRETSDILTTPPIASVIGEGQQRVLNGATTEARGWELALNYTKDWESGLNLRVSTNFGAFKDEITFLPEEVVSSFPGTVQNSILGHSQTAFFGYRTDGLFQSQEEADAHPTGGVQINNARPGGIKFVDLNGDGVIDGNDRDFIGTTLPGMEYGLRVDLNYKNFDFSVFGSGVTGRKGVDPYIYWNNFVQGRDNAGLGVLNAWTPQNTDSDIPSLSLVNNIGGDNDYVLRNNSYFKLRNIQLGYTFPQEAIEKFGGMSNLRVYIQGENLFWITPKDYIGADPERTDVNRIPVPSVTSFGLNMNF